MTARRDGWRSWLPLGSATPMLLLLVLFPSALNVPQTNPSQTLEFAPVPPQDDEPPPPPDSGNISTVGLGNTVTGPTVAGDDPVNPESPSLPPPPPPTTPLPEGEGARPVTKRCVGSPPRQTEDPMSPPCVAHFDGDNGGATAPGVTRDEVVVLVYIEYLPVSAALACSQQGCDQNQFYDLGKPEGESNESNYDEREAYWPHVWRTWQRYFHDRYQIYDRNVHLWVHFGSTDNSPEARIADVAEAADKVDPFAVVADVEVNGQVYAEEWAKRDKVVFMTKTQTVDEVGFDAEFFQRHPGQIWDYQPSVQEMADNYGSFLCSQVVGHPVSFSGDGSLGDPRRLGLLVAGHPNLQNRVDYAALVRQQLEGCGADIASVQVDDHDGSSQALNPVDPARDARIASMRQAGVTTIVNLASLLFYTQAAARQVPEWRPEWIVQMDNSVAIASYEDPEVFQHARNFTIWPKAERGADRPCEQAFLEVEPRDNAWAEAWPVCWTFNTARMLFTGIQVAGPQLTRQSLDQGMHAIPAIPSGDPEVPACFYRPGDYTCVKDAQVQWWDPTGTTDRQASRGCWRSMDGGRRYLPGDWPAVDVDAVRDEAADECNIQGAYS